MPRSVPLLVRVTVYVRVSPGLKLLKLMTAAQVLVLLPPPVQVPAPLVTSKVPNPALLPEFVVWSEKLPKVAGITMTTATAAASAAPSARPRRVLILPKNFIGCFLLHE